MVKRPTLREVSEAAGVSTYTASRALGNHPGVSEKSRNRVQSAARRLGYIPNRAAQNLRTGTRDTVAVITAGNSNSYYIDMMRGIERKLLPAGLRATVSDIAVEGAYSNTVEDATIDGLIRARVAAALATLTLSDRSVDLLRHWGIPLVFVDCAPPDTAPDLPDVSTDNFTASLEVGTHLADHGYRDWLLLAYPKRWSTRIDRERGLREAARVHGARLHVLESHNDEASAYATLADYLERASTPPRAIVAADNPMVHGTLSVLKARNLRVPHDVAVIGFDEFDWAPLLDPPLTVLDEHVEAIGEVAAEMVTQILSPPRADAGPPRENVHRTIPADLILRQSCGCSPHKGSIARRER